MRFITVTAFLVELFFFAAFHKVCATVCSSSLVVMKAVSCTPKEQTVTSLATPRNPTIGGTKRHAALVNLKIPADGLGHPNRTHQFGELYKACRWLPKMLGRYVDPRFQFNFYDIYIHHRCILNRFGTMHVPERTMDGFHSLKVNVSSKTVLTPTTTLIHVVPIPSKILEWLLVLMFY